jgi:hypothetical protein
MLKPEKNRPSRWFVTTIATMGGWHALIPIDKGLVYDCCKGFSNGGGMGDCPSGRMRGLHAPTGRDVRVGGNYVDEHCSHACKYKIDLNTRIRSSPHQGQFMHGATPSAFRDANKFILQTASTAPCRYMRTKLALFLRKYPNQGTVH